MATISGGCVSSSHSSTERAGDPLSLNSDKYIVRRYAVRHPCLPQFEALLTAEEHAWLKGLTPEEAESLRKMYKERYNQ